MGRPHVFGLALSLSLRSPALHATLLGCAQAAFADGSLRQQPSGRTQEQLAGNGRADGGFVTERLYSLHPEYVTVVVTWMAGCASPTRSRSLCRQGPEGR